MPLFSFFFLFFTFANISFPLTASFIPEFFLLVASFNSNYLICILLLLSLIFSTTFSIWLNNRILYGNLSPYIKSYLDLSFNEFLCLIPFLFFTLLFGIFSKPLTSLFTLALINIIA